MHDHLSGRPVLLGPNQPPARPYRGGPGIARLRGTGDTRLDVPEDFVASTTEVAAGGGVGLSTLPDGRTLREHIGAEPEAYLGPRHVAAFGADPALLVKLLDTAERLFVHFHPDDDFAARHLNCRFGKTEAWYVVDVPERGTGEVYLGFRRDVELAEVRGWVERQDTEALLAALNRVEVVPGDAILVPGGTPHAIGAGLTVVELQEPTDFSILLEWAGYGVGPQDADLGLGMETALGALDRSGWSAERLAGVTAATRRRTERPGVSRLFPPAADRFFRAEHVEITEPIEFAAEFAVLIVLSGSGQLVAGGDTVPLRRGSVLLVPYAAGTVHLLGELEAIRCLLPETP